MGAAIRTILIADLVMSIDNVIAVAAAASRAPEHYRLILLIIGLATSIPLIIVGSTLLMKIMERFPIIITAGAALLGWLAGEMFATDPAIVAPIIGTNAPRKTSTPMAMTNGTSRNQATSMMPTASARATSTVARTNWVSDTHATRPDASTRSHQISSPDR